MSFLWNFLSSSWLSLLSWDYAALLGTGLSVVVLFLILIPRLLLVPPPPPPRGEKYHAIVTGGSSGIGLAIAQELVRKHSFQIDRITLVARNVEKLKEAQKLVMETSASSSNVTVDTCSVNVGNYATLERAVSTELTGCTGKARKQATLLFCVAGTSSSAKMVDTAPEEMEGLMRTNYLGTAYMIRAMVPYMAPGSRIVLTSSAAGQVGVFGYSAYAPTKAALASLAQVLSMELTPQQILVQIAYPPDTDTPGYALEQEGKPTETHRISEQGGLFQPKTVARIMVQSALSKNPPFSVWFGLEGWMLTTLTAGMSPIRTLGDYLSQTLLMSLLRFISLFYLADFARTIAKCAREQEEELATSESTATTNNDINVAGSKTKKS